MKEKFDTILKLIRDKELIHAVLSSPSSKQAEGILRVSVRPLMIKAHFMYQISEHYRQKVVHRNVAAEDLADLVNQLMPDGYLQGMFSMQSSNYHVLVNKQKEMTIIKKESTEAKLNLAHNRTKQYLLQEGVPIPFLVELGVMTEQGKVVAKKYDKFRQINRFVEMVSDVIEYLPKDRPIEIVDFGCGKAYLTFALYHYLHLLQGREVKIWGLDLKQEVIDHCQALADKLGYHTLKFSKGDINHFQAKGNVDMVISLHACDTATDAALEKAVRWGSEVILCVPCCQHEVNGQIASRPLASLLRYGILKERMASLVTDAARAELLTVLGYEVQVLEFIDMEHTPKNLLLRAVKGVDSKKQKEALERYHLLKNELQITPSLEVRFQKEAGF